MILLSLHCRACPSDVLRYLRAVTCTSCELQTSPTIFTRCLTWFILSLAIWMYSSSDHSIFWFIASISASLSRLIQQHSTCLVFLSWRDVGGGKGVCVYIYRLAIFRDVVLEGGG